MERAPLLGAPRPVAAARRLAAFSPRGYATVLLVLVLFNVADNVLVVVLFDEFPEELAQYVNQGTALVYIVWCSAILLVRKRCRKRRTLPTAGGLRSTCFVVVVAPPGARPLSLVFFRSLFCFLDFCRQLRPPPPRRGLCLLSLFSGSLYCFFFLWLFLLPRPSCSKKTHTPAGRWF
jgi:hypothetical protein